MTSVTSAHTAVTVHRHCSLWTLNHWTFTTTFVSWLPSYRWGRCLRPRHQHVVLLKVDVAHCANTQYGFRAKATKSFDFFAPRLLSIGLPTTQKKGSTDQERKHRNSSSNKGLPGMTAQPFRPISLPLSWGPLATVPLLEGKPTICLFSNFTFWFAVLSLLPS